MAFLEILRVHPLAVRISFRLGMGAVTEPMLTANLIYLWTLAETIVSLLLYGFLQCGQGKIECRERSIPRVDKFDSCCAIALSVAFSASGVAFKTPDCANDAATAGEMPSLGDAFPWGFGPCASIVSQ